jgi:hypothetical protein
MPHRIINLSHNVVHIVNKKIRKNKLPLLKSTHLILTDSFKNSAWILLESNRTCVDLGAIFNALSRCLKNPF